MDIVNKEVESYIESYLSYEKDLIGEIQKEALENHIPIIPKDTVAFISNLLNIKKPKYILEIGTAVGFSSSVMSKFLVDGGKITTIEKNKDMIKDANRNFSNLGINDKINLIEGDATEILKTLEGKYDVIFLDAAKSQYINIISYCLILLNKDGIILADNVLQGGTVANNIEDISRRHRTIHKRMNSFIDTMFNNKDLITTIIPIGDGLLMSSKI